VSFPDLELEGWGDDEIEALGSFADQFAGMWDWIALSADAELTPAPAN